jgi:hypothetical protein
MWQRSLPLLETEHGKGAMFLQAAAVSDRTLLRS